MKFAVDDSMDERSLVRKLATLWHLNVPERRALPNQRAKVSLVCQAIAAVLSEKGWFPSDWRPDDDYDGGVIEVRPNGTCHIHWKAEVGVNRFAPMRVDHQSNALEAAAVWLEGMFPADIDGIPLDWNS